MRPSLSKTLAGSTVAALAVAAALVAGCNAGSGASPESSATATYQELGSQLQNCVSSALDCLKTANCDAAKDQACRDDFMACHAQNKAAFEAFHQAAKDCFAQTRMCVADAGSSGTSGASGWGAFTACKQQLHSCIDDSRPIAPPPGPCMQALAQCVQDKTQQPSTCYEQARTCFMDRLPPRCGGGTGGAGGTGGSTGTGGM